MVGDTDIKDSTFRCGYCGQTGPRGRCVSCGSAMDDEEQALAGAAYPHLIKRWLDSRDRAWELVAATRTELYLRSMEDLEAGRDLKRFDVVPDPREN
jgi:hypothetical protein